MEKDYDRQKDCIYKGERYSVRDNGTVLRYTPEGKKPRPADNQWTYGKYNSKTGYAEIVGERVHRIVATAFWGPAPTQQHVVDHIDTNRRNNRPENLRWVSKLENVLLNPITVRRIELICGSIEEFLRDPSKLRSSSFEPNFEWMRAVSKDEASICLEHLLNWSKNDKSFSGGSLGEWIYRRGVVSSNNGQKSFETIKPQKNNVAALKSTVDVDEKAIPPKKKITSKSNPFGFPRTDNLNSNNDKLYRTSQELFELLKSIIEQEKEFIFPDILFHTMGKGILIKKSWTERFNAIKYCYSGKSKIAKYILMESDNSTVALFVRMKTGMENTEINNLKQQGYDIIEMDLSWARNGVTAEEMRFLLVEDITKKRWICHTLLEDVCERVYKICEPIEYAGKGVAHHYFVCPLSSNNVQDIDCFYCDYRLRDDEQGEYCFGKVCVKSYEELMSIKDVKKEEGQIVRVSFNINGDNITKNYGKRSSYQFKTLSQIWKEKQGESVVAHNMHSDWYVLLESNPDESIKLNGNIFAKISRNVDTLGTGPIRSIWGYDNNIWEVVK